MQSHATCRSYACESGRVISRLAPRRVRKKNTDDGFTVGVVCFPLQIDFDTVGQTEPRFETNCLNGCDRLDS